MNFVKEWLNRAEKEVGDENAVFRFFCLFIAFNYLYKEYKNVKRKDGKSRSNSEKEQINLLLDEAQKHIREFRPYEVLDADSEILKTPVKSVQNLRSGNTKEVISKEKLAQKDIKELFHSVYTVRCNLFHGSKVLNEERDKKLVAECSTILEYFLTKYNDSYELGE